MTDWPGILRHTAADVERHFDLLKFRLRERVGGRDPIMILPYRGYGRPDRVYLKGRVLEDRGINPAAEDDTVWDNLVNMYRRFKSNEIPYARVRATLGAASQEVMADEEGFFNVFFEPAVPLATTRLWHEMQLETARATAAGQPARAAKGEVLVPPARAEYGVISDIDDTVIYTNATNVIRIAARTVFLGNARMRLPFKGAAAFYRALFGGSTTIAENPLFYVSSAPWNLYDLLRDFFHLHHIPIGPLLFLRDWGLSEEEFLPISHRRHKLGVIRTILDLYDYLPFILIGDSGQQTPRSTWRSCGPIPAASGPCTSATSAAIPNGLPPSRP